MNKKHWFIAFIVILAVGIIVYNLYNYYPEEKPIAKKRLEIGDSIDQFNGVDVFYNGRVANVLGRNVTKDGYNLGLKYQCVEFVKRYYYTYFNHKMPDSYGHAKDFFDKKIKDGSINPRRNLLQFSNHSRSRPKVNDLIIFDATSNNKFGHVAIISKVSNKDIEIIQQNPGPTAKSRVKIPVVKKNQKWVIQNKYVLGWLRIK